MEFLDGSSTRVELGGGYTLTAPGVKGTAVTHAGTENATRQGGLEQAEPFLDEVFERLDISEIKVIELDVSVAPVAAAEILETRTMDGSPGMVLEVPDLGPDDEIVVMVIDDGVVTWSYPEDRVNTAETRGGATRKFVIRQPVTSEPTHMTHQTRGFIGAIGKRILRVLVYPIADLVLGPGVKFFAHRWESKNRPYTVRTFNRDNYNTKVVDPLTGVQWQSLTQGRALLFVHGTFSSTHSAFGNLSQETVVALEEKYEGRVFAFDHPTVSVSPDENVRVFVEHAMQHLTDKRLDIDIVCHSRGGLVARSLAGEFGNADISRVSVGKTIFVATPNQGTLLANPDHMVAFIDRYTSALDFAPPGPVQVISDILEALLVVVKVIGHAGLVALDGLVAQNPDGELMLRLGQGAPDNSNHYAIAANYEPKGNFAKYIADNAVDKIFDQAPNDIVVPTSGVSLVGSGQFDSSRMLTLAASRGIWHGDYFGQVDVQAAILKWL